jgi:nucleoredoxin
MAILAGGNIRAADKTGDENQSGDGEPWPALFSDGLVDADGERVSLDDLNGKLVGVYFSAHWCPPCKAFTPRLVAFRDENTADFEVVFVSSDRSRQARDAYMKEANMKWPTVPFRSRSARKLKADFGIRTLPTLIVLSPDGNTVSTSARTEVTWTPKSCLKKWQAAAEKADKE